MKRHRVYGGTTRVSKMLVYYPQGEGCEDRGLLERSSEMTAMELITRAKSQVDTQGPHFGLRTGAVLGSAVGVALRA